MIEYRLKLSKKPKSTQNAAKINEVTQKIDYQIQKFLKNRENKRIRKMQTKFQYLSNLLKSIRQKIPTLVDCDKNPIFSHQKKAELLSEHFSSVFYQKQCKTFPMPIILIQIILIILARKNIQNSQWSQK
jgi:hypothetical protein